jgi:membrane-associated phospholipid phosphatase
MTGRPSSRPTNAWALASASGAALLALAILVRLGLSRPFDEAVRQWARPDDVWGPLQMRADVIVEGLRPTSTLLLMAGVVAAVSLVRRSTRPLLVAAATSLLMVSGTIGAKLLLHRPDPHGALSDHGGSFPSGHTATVVVCTGLVTMLVGPGGRWWSWLTTLLLGTMMGAALLLQAAHWVTDVVGGGLVGVTMLATMLALRADRWCADAPPRADVVRATSSMRGVRGSGRGVARLKAGGAGPAGPDQDQMRP